MSGATIEEGCRVIIQKGTYLRSEEVRRKNKISVQKLYFFLDNAIGCLYGTTFKVEKNGQLTISNAIEEQPKPSSTSGENNQFLNDDGSSQKLTKDAIMDLKAKGFGGEDIIEQLVENSATFETKTEFSQEKYLNKKQKRHLAQITILKPTLRLVCEMMYMNWALKIIELRLDTVSQILTMANIHSNINVLLLENTQSFLAGTILHRMAGQGNVVQLFNGDFPIRLLLPHFGLGEDETKILSGFPMHKINILRSLENEDTQPQETSTEVAEEIDAAECGDSEEPADPCDDVIEESASQKNDEPSISSEKTKRKVKRKKHYSKPLSRAEKLKRKVRRTEEESKALELLKQARFDCLIIATKFRSKTAVLRLIEFLAPSRPVVVFSPYKEVLTECFTALKESKSVINLDLTETWLRSYQVLTQRTHPYIMMDGSGGYLLTGIKVEHGLSPTDNPVVNPSPDVKPSVDPVNPTNPDPNVEEKLDIDPGTFQINSETNTERDTNLTNLKDSPKIKTENPSRDSVEPPAKRTKSC